MFRQGCGGKLIIARGPPILVRFVLASVCLSFSWSFFFLVFLFPGLSFCWSFFLLAFISSGSSSRPCISALYASILP
jgi:hypothetical protein